MTDSLGGVTVNSEQAFEKRHLHPGRERPQR